LYKNAIFDIGNVLLSFKPIEYFRNKFTDENKIQLLYNIIFKSKEWVMLDRGTITNREALDIFTAKSMENKSSISLAFENWTECLSPINGTIEILKELKEADYNLYYLSNFHQEAFKYIIEAYDFFELFNGGVVSYEVRMLKPEDGIYTHLIEKYNLSPRKSVFIDDTEANVKGAEKAGFNTILFTEPNKFREQLKSFGILSKK